MNTSKSNGDIKVPYDQLFAKGVEALERINVPAEDAKITVQVLLRADLRGVGTHGIKRLTMYIPRLKQGLINPRPNITVKQLSSALKLVDGDNGLGPVVATRGMREAIHLAQETGISFVGCRDSNHFSAAAPYVLMACEKRLIGIAGTNSFPVMSPWGGLEGLVGNNPLAIGVPSEGSNPFVLDMAMSVSSRGRIRMMGERGEKIPEGWAIDKNGQPTTDPLEALKGFVLPVGLFKGYGLAVAMDILSGVVTGSAYSNDVKSLLQQWEEPQHIGHFFITIDPARFMAWEVFSERMKDISNRLRSAQRIRPDLPVLIAGDLENALEKERRQKGIPMDVNDLSKLNDLADGKYDIEVAKF